ncbi:MAG: hypothetical protein K0U20_01200 [Proteobacteria bacterium]|nr:hypothetical protein [Pseudomonadota bacterium]MCH9749920.1 hypothetical protein [Pseudomonadota bacterium]
MNKLILFLSLSLLATLNSYGQWSPIITTKFGSIHYVNMSSIKTNKQYIYYWAMENSHETDMFGALSKAWYIQADCHINKYKILSTVLYKAKDGKQRFNTFNKDNPSWDFPTPGSVAYKEITYMCKSVMNGKNN